MRSDVDVSSRSGEGMRCGGAVGRRGGVSGCGRCVDSTTGASSSGDASSTEYVLSLEEALDVQFAHTTHTLFGPRLGTATHMLDQRRVRRDEETELLTSRLMTPKRLEGPARALPRHSKPEDVLDVRAILPRLRHLLEDVVHAVFLEARLSTHKAKQGQ
jgi:hypothetical protein